MAKGSQKYVPPVHKWPEGTAEAGWPAWITKEELERLTPEARREVEELLLPGYRELVTEAESALERAAWTTWCTCGGWSCCTSSGSAAS